MARKNAELSLERSTLVAPFDAVVSTRSVANFTTVGAGQPAALRPVFLAGAGAASALWFAALGYGARLLTPLFARPAAWRVLDLAVAALMFGIAWQLIASRLQ